MKRIATGIKGFDPLLDGGFPEASSILVCGAPGTGKSIFGLEFLYHGATKYGENGLYVSIEENPDKLRDQAEQFGWNFADLEKTEKIRFLRIPIDISGINIVSLIDKEIKKNNATRVVIDSLSILGINAPRFMLPILRTPVEDSQRIMSRQIEAGFFSSREVDQFIYVFLSKVNALGVLSIYIADAPQDDRYLSRDTVSEFVCDGVVHLKMLPMGKTINRTLEIKKMRNTKIKAGINTLTFEKDGLKISSFEY